MKVLVTGATGLIGSALIPYLNAHGHKATGLARCSATPADRKPSWCPLTGEVSADAAQDMDAIVHLAGVNITAKRWTDKFKAEMRSSRIDATEALCTHLANSSSRPKVMISASAVGVYGDRGDEVLTEASAAGTTGFFPDLASAWEQACKPLRDAGTRVVNLRIGIVLSPRGGALKKMLLPFKMFVGGVLGSGQQYMSWISIDDMVSIIGHALNNESLSGPVNATAPNPVTNSVFTRTLGKVLGRPTIVPVPALAARLAFGEMADEALLSSVRVIPKKISESGYVFQHAHLEAALRHTLNRPA